jgi:hypothetical protein
VGNHQWASPPYATTHSPAGYATDVPGRGGERAFSESSTKGSAVEVNV